MTSLFRIGHFPPSKYQKYHMDMNIIISFVLWYLASICFKAIKFKYFWSIISNVISMSLKIYTTFYVFGVNIEKTSYFLSPIIMGFFFLLFVEWVFLLPSFYSDFSLLLHLPSWQDFCFSSAFTVRCKDYLSILIYLPRLKIQPPLYSLLVKVIMQIEENNWAKNRLGTAYTVNGQLFISVKIGIYFAWTDIGRLFFFFSLLEYKIQAFNSRKNIDNSLKILV